MQDKALERDRQAGLGELTQEKESSGRSSTDADNYRHQIKRLLEGSKAEKAMREAISNQLKRAKEEIDRLKEHLQAANARVDDLTQEKDKYTTELEVSRYETQLARDQLEILRSDNPIRANELLGIPLVAPNTVENAVPTDTEPLDAELASLSQQLVPQNEHTITEVIDLGSEPGSPIEGSATFAASSRQQAASEKSDTRAKMSLPSADGVESAKKLLDDLIFLTNGVELRLHNFPEETQLNFAKALAVVMDDKRTNVNAFKEKAHRKNCLPCTSGHRSCDFKDGDDFACKAGSCILPVLV